MRETEQWLAEMRDHLQRFPRRRRPILDELADHLLVSVEELRAAGLDASEAEREALRRLGDPRPLAAEFAGDIARNRSITVTRLVSAVLLSTFGLVWIPVILALLRGPFTPGPELDYVRLAPDSLSHNTWLWLVAVGLAPLVYLAAIAFSAGRWIQLGSVAAGTCYLGAVTATWLRVWPPAWIQITTWALVTLVALAGAGRPSRSVRTLSPRLASVAVCAIAADALAQLLASGIAIPHNLPGVLMALPNLAVLFLSPICLIALISYSDAHSVTGRLSATRR